MTVISFEMPDESKNQRDTAFLQYLVELEFLRNDQLMIKSYMNVCM